MDSGEDPDRRFVSARAGEKAADSHVVIVLELRSGLVLEFRIV